MVQSLKLADDLFPLVHSGRKHVTIRLGRKDIALGPLVFIPASGTRSPIVVTVDEVRHLKAGRIDRETAEMNGYHSPSDYYDALRRFYPDLVTSDEVTVVIFTT